MHINLHQLHFFYSVSSTGSIKQAAEELCVTPAAISLQLRNLEEFLGYNLFNNKKGRVSLSREGKKIYSFAAEIFKHVEDLEWYLDTVKAKSSDELILGSHHSTSQFFLPAILEHVKNVCPELEVKLNFIDKRQKFYEEILAQRLHAAIIIGDTLNPQIASKTICASRLVLVVAADGRLAKINRISAKELGNIPLVLPPKGTGMHAAIMQFISKYCGKSSMIKQELRSDIDMLKITMRQHKDVASFATLFSVRYELAAGSLHKIHVAEPLPSVPINIAYARGGERCPALQKFLDALAGFSFCE